MKQVIGLHIGIVVGTKDPAGESRLQINMPQLLTGPFWARVCNSAGAKMGATAVIGFEAGDLSRPIVLGFLS